MRINQAFKYFRKFNKLSIRRHSVELQLLALIEER
jgi:hypothetical protein